MKRCITCAYCYIRDGVAHCNIVGYFVNHPYFMGRKCECYEKRCKKKSSFVYPSLDDKERKIAEWQLEEK